MDNVQLTLADLASLHSILEAAAQRGAFRANELTQVGSVYDKLSAFLQTSQAQMNASDQTKQSGETNA